MVWCQLSSPIVLLCVSGHEGGVDLCLVLHEYLHNNDQATKIQLLIKFCSYVWTIRGFEVSHDSI